MITLYNPATSKQARRGHPRIAGYYTTREAADKLDMNVGTLKYRRDHADAKTLWHMLGNAEEDATYRLLAESHRMLDGKHYYERKLFDKFAKKYLARPEVQRARKLKTTWDVIPTPCITQDISSENQIHELAAALIQLRKKSPKLHVIVLEQP